jgi:hypothetical protein
MGHGQPYLWIGRAGEGDRKTRRVDNPHIMSQANQFFDRAFQGGDDTADLRGPSVGGNRNFHRLIGFARMKEKGKSKRASWMILNNALYLTSIRPERERR